MKSFALCLFVNENTHKSLWLEAIDQDKSSAVNRKLSLGLFLDLSHALINRTIKFYANYKFSALKSGKQSHINCLSFLESIGIELRSDVSRFSVKI